MKNHKRTQRRVRSNIGNILKVIAEDQKLKKIRVKNDYIRKKRLIPQTTYCKLKAQRKCDRCGKEINYPPELHHIKFKRLGGSNKEKNLLCLCHECHTGIHHEDKSNVKS